MRMFGVKTLLSQHTTDDRFSFVLRSSDYGLTIGTTDNWMIRIATGQGWDSRHRPQQPARRDNPAPTPDNTFQPYSFFPSCLPPSVFPSISIAIPPCPSLFLPLQHSITPLFTVRQLPPCNYTLQDRIRKALNLSEAGARFYRQ
jgi:hypothetical protein